MDRAKLGYLARGFQNHGIETLADIFDEELLSDADLRNKLSMNGSEIVRLRRYMDAALLPEYEKTGWCYGSVILNEKVKSVFANDKDQEDEEGEGGGREGEEDSDRRRHHGDDDAEKLDEVRGVGAAAAVRAGGLVRRMSVAFRSLLAAAAAPTPAGNEETKDDDDNGASGFGGKPGKVHPVLDGDQRGSRMKVRYSHVFHAQTAKMDTMSQNSAQFSELHSVQDEDIVGDSLISGWFHSGFTDKPAPMHLKALQDKFGGKNAVKYLAHPKIWTSKRDATEMQLVNVPLTTAVATRINILMKETWVGPHTSSFRKFQLKAIQRVENPTVWQTYAMKRQSMMQRTDREGIDKADKRLVEANLADSYEHIWLFWACSTPDTVAKVVSQGFNRFTCGRNVMQFGKGISLDTQLWSATERSYADSDGIKRVICCRVLVGEPEIGYNGQPQPSSRRIKGGNVPYDSTTDNTNPEKRLKFVVYNDAQVYPEYVVECK